MYRLYRCVRANEASQSSHLEWGVTESKPYTLQSWIWEEMKSLISARRLEDSPSSPTSALAAFETHSRGIKQPHNMNSGGIFLTKKIFTAFCQSQLAEFAFSFCLVSLLATSVGTTEGNITPCLENVSAIPHIPCIYFCRKIPYPRSTTSAVVCRDSHVE